MKEKLGKTPAFPATVSFEGGQMQESYQIGNYEARFMGMSQRLLIAKDIMKAFMSNPSVSLNTEAIPFLVTKAYLITDEILKQESL